LVLDQYTGDPVLKPARLGRTQEGVGGGPRGALPPARTPNAQFLEPKIGDFVTLEEPFWTADDSAFGAGDWRGDRRTN